MERHHLYQVAIVSGALFLIFLGIFVSYLEIYRWATGHSLNFSDSLARTAVPHTIFILGLISGLVLTSCAVFYLISVITTF